MLSFRGEGISRGQAIMICIMALLFCCWGIWYVGIEGYGDAGKEMYSRVMISGLMGVLAAVCTYSLYRLIFRYTQ